MPALLTLVAATFVAVFFARSIAIARNRSATGWMWAAALFPPSVLALAAIPRRAGTPGVQI